jgi:hypothetical protein
MAYSRQWRLCLPTINPSKRTIDCYLLECPDHAANHYFAAQSFRTVAAKFAVSHFPSVWTRLNKSVPQWSTLPDAPPGRN